MRRIGTRLLGSGCLVALVILAGAAPAASGKPKPPPTNDALVQGFAAVGVPILHADVTFAALSAPKKTGVGGYFNAVVPKRALKQSFVVSAKDGRRSGQLFLGTLAAVVPKGNAAPFVYLNPVSTLVARYAQAHPRAGVARATSVVYRFLGIPSGTAPNALTARSPLFDGTAFLDAAQSAGGFDTYVKTLVRQMARPGARHSFAGVAKNDIGGSIASVLVSRLATSLLNKGCEAGGELESFLNDLGQCPSQANSQITTQLNNIQSDLTTLNSEVSAIEADDTELNWNEVFGDSNSALQDIVSSLPTAKDELQAMNSTAQSMGAANAAACPSYYTLTPGSGDCYTFRFNEYELGEIVGRFDSTDRVSIYNGLTGSTENDILGSTFLGATQDLVTGTLNASPATKPLLDATNNARLVDVWDYYVGLQAEQYDMIITYQKLQLPVSHACPAIQLTNPDVTANSDDCFWAESYEYQLAQEELPQFTVQSLPSDLVVDSRNGMIWNAYPQQVCDTIFGATPCGGGDLSNPDPDYAVSPITDPAAKAACIADQTSPQPDWPIYQWTNLPGSCLNDYVGSTNQALAGCDVSVCGYQNVTIGPILPTSSYGGAAHPAFGIIGACTHEIYWNCPSVTYFVPAPDHPANGGNLFWSGYSQFLTLVSGWTGSPGGWLTSQGFQDITTANSGNWSIFTDPGTGQQTQMGSSYAPFCAAISIDSQSMFDSGQYGFAYYPVWVGAGCFASDNFELQDGWGPANTQFAVTADDYKTLPAPTSLPSGS